MIIMPRRKQKHRRMVIAMIIFLAVAAITRHWHTERDAEVPS